MMISWNIIILPVLCQIPTSPQAERDYNQNYRPLPKYYADVNVNRPQKEWDYINEAIPNKLGNIDDYDTGDALGEGKYGDVVIGTHKTTGDKVAIKMIKNEDRPEKVRREIMLLNIINNGPNIIKFRDVIKDNVNTTTMVFNYVENNRNTQEFYPTLTELDIIYYTRELLVALEYVHSHGIMHRDIKPYNIMIDHAQKKLRLIDFGLGEFFFKDTPKNVRVAARWYKTPELLTNFRYYHYAVDVFSVGLWFGALLFKRYPLFRGKDDDDQIIAVGHVMGTEGLQKYMKKYGLSLKKKMQAELGEREGIKWIDMVSPSRAGFCTPEALDLLDKILRWDPQERITVKDALQHEYFKPVIDHPDYPLNRYDNPEDEKLDL